MLVGRDAEIAKVRALLAAPRARIVTLHGPPGIGKTAIANAVVAESDAVVVCDLTNAKTYEDVCFCVAGATGVSLGGGSDLAGVLGDALGSKLLVLDGGEVAADAVARLVSELGTTRVLVSSREVLRVEGEIAVSIEPLGDAAARDLFVSAAERVRPGFDANAQEKTLGPLLAALSGVPLAIVLAASRLAIVDIESLFARIRDRLDFLAAKRRDAPDRHASLRSAFESSFATLDASSRDALVQCTVFRGDFALEDAEHVIALAHHEQRSVADALQSLVEKSLVRAREEEGAGVRFSMLAIVRRLVLDASSDDALVRGARDRHAAYFAHAGAVWDESNWYGGVASLPRLRAMHGDLLAAHAHAPSLESAIALYPIFAAQGPHPAFLELLDEARDDRACEAAPAALAARFLLVRGRALQLCAMREEAAKAFEKSLQYARKASVGPSGRALAARALAWLALARRTQGAMTEARERFEASAALFRDAGDSSSEAVVLSGLASLDLGEGDLDAARRALESAIDVLLRAGDAATAAMMRVDLGIVLQEMGDLEGARGVYESALVAHRAAGNKRHEGITLGYLGTLEDEADRVDAAEVALSHGLALVRETSDAKFVAVFAGALAAVRAERDDARGAREALAEADRAARGSEARIAATVALHRLRVEAMAGASARVVAEKRGAALGLVQQSDDVRFAARMLDRIAVELDADAALARASALVVAEDTTWLELPSGKRIDLRRRAVQRRLVEILVRQRLSAPGSPVSTSALVAAGWPGEKLAESSAQNRLHVALATLRSDGLRDLLAREPGGYLLDTATDVRVER